MKLPISLEELFELDGDAYNQALDNLYSTGPVSLAWMLEFARVHEARKELDIKIADNEGNHTFLEALNEAREVVLEDCYQMVEEQYFPGSVQLCDCEECLVARKSNNTNEKLS